MKLVAILLAVQLAACLIHEAGHAAAAQWFGLPWKMRMGWLGPYVRVQGRYVAHENAVVALAGPLASFAGALIVRRCGLPFCALFVALIGMGNLLPLPCTDLSNAIEAMKLRKA